MILGYLSLDQDLTGEITSSSLGLTGQGGSLLPSYTTAGYPNTNKEIFTDIRVEPDKKNLLTLPTDPNKMYIKSAGMSYFKNMFLSFDTYHYYGIISRIEDLLLFNQYARFIDRRN